VRVRARVKARVRAKVRVRGRGRGRCSGRGSGRGTVCSSCSAASMSCGCTPLARAFLSGGSSGRMVSRSCLGLGLG
jgi:hypothetical protein